ncbi:MAG: alpha/beta hydrolase [Cyanobacteria bacterium P01_A01_bin.17]
MNPLEINDTVIFERTVTVNGHNIYYRAAGESHSKTVLLLHAIASDSSQWLQNISALAEHFRVIAPDLIGFGQSDKPQSTYTVRSLVSFLHDFTQHIGVEPVTLVGQSLGAAIALHYALAHPSKVNRIVNVSGGYGYRLPDVENVDKLGFASGSLQLLNPTSGEKARQLLSLIIHDQQVAQSNEVVDLLISSAQLSSEANQSLIESFARREDGLDNKLNSLVSPTLIIWGRDDKLTPLSLGERFQREIPNSRLMAIERCAHAPYIEQVEQFNQAVIHFLKD